MGILIKSIVSQSNLKPKRVRISEDDSLDPPMQSSSSTGVGTGYGTSLTRSGLVRRNAIRRRWRRRLPHNPSPTGQDTTGVTSLIPPRTDDNESIRALPDFRISYPGPPSIRHLHPPSRSPSATDHDMPPFLPMDARPRSPSSNLPRPQAGSIESISRAESYRPPQPPHSIISSSHDTPIPPPSIPGARDLEGLSLSELENRANQLRRRLSERHNIRINFAAAPDEQRPPGGFTSRTPSDLLPPDHEMVLRLDNDNDNFQDNDDDDFDDDERSTNDRNNEEQREQSLLYEIRRRVRMNRRANNRPPQPSSSPRNEELGPPTPRRRRSRSNVDEYEALMQETEPSQNWRRRAFRIFRNNNLSYEGNDNDEVHRDWVPMNRHSQTVQDDGANVDNDITNSAGAIDPRIRREQNRHAFVTSIGDDEDDDDDSTEELRLSFGR